MNTGRRGAASKDEHNDPLKSTLEVFVTIVMVIGITKRGELS